MTHIFNDPVNFREEMIEGYAAAYARYLRRVPGASGVIAVSAPQPGRVAVVVGGGSGHFPAFYGYVGEGLASGSVIGDVFASPSGEQVYRVAKAADGGAGILFLVGNYSGDVLNFGMAQNRLRAEGTDARTVIMADDVLSAPKHEAEKRRGIAGLFYVFKSAGASAACGDDISTVEAFAQRAANRVRTVGVAFAGCTLPGRSGPLFLVDEGQMEIGLGIHGEPGVRTSNRLGAREIAKLLVDTLVDEAPSDAGSRAAVLVNGLGATKYEELFVLYDGITQFLAGAGIDAYEPRIGEFVTSLDMAGCSLSLFWLDDELRTLHDAPASSPAFTGFGPDGNSSIGVVKTSIAAQTLLPEPEAENYSATSGEVGKAGAVAFGALLAALATIEEHEHVLGQLDAATGDGDHGVGMVRGFRAAVSAIHGELTAHETLLRAGIAFMNAAGGASGALVGAGLQAFGEALPRDDDGVDSKTVATSLEIAVSTIAELGGAQPGDKTLLDTLQPFTTAFRQAANDGQSTASAWATALPAAETGMRSTAGMVSRVGRASRLGERSLGHLDPGASSLFYILRAIAAKLTEH